MHWSLEAIGLYIGLKQVHVEFKASTKAMLYREVAVLCDSAGSVSRPGRFQPWPEDALLNVAQKFLTKLDELGAQEGISTASRRAFSTASARQDSPARLAIVDFFPHSFEALCT